MIDIDKNPMSGKEGFGSDSPDRPEDTASPRSLMEQRNATLANDFNKAMREFHKRLEELEYAAIGFQKLQPLPSNADLDDVRYSLNYLIAMLNKSLTEV